MTGPQKFSLSLLISAVIFAGFAIWSYVGLYSTIETSFFRSRVEESVLKQVAEIDRAAADYISGLEKELSAFFQQDFLISTYRINQAAADIIARSSAISTLRQKYRINSIRMFDQVGALHESTRLSDIKDQTPAKSIEWVSKSDLQSEVPLESILLGDSRSTRWLLDAGSNQLIFSVPVVDANQVVYGTAVVYLNLQQLTMLNQKWARTSGGERFHILDRNTLLINMPQEEPDTLAESLLEGLKQLGSEKRFRVFDKNTGATWYAYVSKSAIKDTTGVFLVDTDELEFPAYMRFILLGIIFLTVFLITFLLLNLRHDEMVVLSDRIKRLQINVLRQYVDRKDVEGFDGERWQSELKARRPEVRETIKRGLRGRQRKDPAIDDLIDKEWDEILDVLGGRRATAAVASPMDLSRLEELVEKVISNYQHQVGHLPAPATKVVAARPMAVPVTPAKPTGPIGSSEPAETEDLEELDDLEEMDEVEPIEAAEELDEIEEVEEAEVIAEAEELEEAEEITEAEELDEAEEIGEAEELEEMAEEIVEVAEAEADEELDEIEEVAAAEEAEPIDEIPEYDTEIPDEVEYDLEPIEDDEPVQVVPPKTDSVPVPATRNQKIQAASALTPPTPSPEPAEVAPEPGELEGFAETVDGENAEELADYEELEELADLDSGDIPGLVTGYQLRPDSIELSAGSLSLGSLSTVKELEYLVSLCKGTISLKLLSELVSLDDLKAWKFQELDEGVVQIPDVVYSRSAGPLKDGALGQLVESVITEAAEERTGVKLGISGLLGFGRADVRFGEDDLSFSSEEVKIHQTVEHVPEKRTFYHNRHDRAQNVILTERGIDLDYFLTNFRDDDGGRIKAMYSFSKRFKAESALLCRLEKEGLAVLRTLGIPHFSGTKISYRDGGDSLTDLVTNPAVVHFRSIPVLTSLLGQPCVDPAVAKVAVWLPVIYQNSLAYVIFGYSQLADLPRYLSDYIEVLPIEKSEE